MAYPAESPYRNAGDGHNTIQVHADYRVSQDRFLG